MVCYLPGSFADWTRPFSTPYHINDEKKAKFELFMNNRNRTLCQNQTNGASFSLLNVCEPSLIKKKVRLNIFFCKWSDVLNRAKSVFSIDHADDALARWHKWRSQTLSPLSIKKELKIVLHASKRVCAKARTLLDCIKHSFAPFFLYKKGSKIDSGLWKFSNISSEVSNALSRVFICDLELYLCVIEIWPSRCLE